MSTAGLAKLLKGEWCCILAAIITLTFAVLQNLGNKTILPHLSKALRHYRILKFHVESLQFFDLGHLMKRCPACPPGRCSVALDGNFRLARLRHGSKDDSYSDLGINFFFIDADTTKRACSSVTDAQPLANECSNFEAGSAFRGSSAYDEKGIFGSFCARHEYPLVFAHLFHGERLSYADLVLDQTFANYSTKEATVFYDIACKYEKHVRVKVSYFVLVVLLDWY